MHPTSAATISAALALLACCATSAAGTPSKQQVQCVAAAMWHEARGESIENRVAVAAVVRNRSIRDRVSYCSVVTAPKQFSWYTPSRLQQKLPRQYIAVATKLVRLWSIGVALDPTNGATHFHSSRVAPSWAKRMAMKKRIGQMRFFAEKG